MVLWEVTFREINANFGLYDSEFEAFVPEVK